MIEHPIATRLAAEKACQSRVWTYTVGIVNTIRDVDPYRRMDGEAAATGSAGRWGKHYFILSASHVIHKDAKPSDLRLFWRPYGEDQYAADKDLKPEHIVDAIAIQNPQAVIHRCGWEDLAVVTIDKSEAGPYSEFIDIGTRWIDPAVNEWINVCGFPYDKRVCVDDRMVTEYRREVKNALRPEIFSGQVLSGPDFATNDFVPDRHYLVPYVHKTSGYPGGFSGAAAWWESDKPQQVWSPNFKFAGVCTHCYKHRNPILERIIKASAVRRFLEEVLGNPAP
jgi:hypothetical protein